MNDGEGLIEELRERLLRSGAEPKDLAPLPGQQERAEQILASILVTSRVSTPTPITRRRRGRTALVSGLVAAAAIVLAFVLVLQPGPQLPPAQAGTPRLLSFSLAPDGALPGDGGSATAELEELAELRAPQMSPGAGDVQRVTIDAWWASSVDEAGAPAVESTLVPAHTVSYFSPDATLRMIERRGAPLTTSGRIDEQADLTDAPITSDDSFPSPEPGPGYAAGLPTSAEGLRTALAQDDDPTLCADYEAACLANDMIDLHRTYVVPPAVDAAFWSALADEPAVTYLGSTTDRVGRPAVAFTLPSSDEVSRIVLFADPATGSFLGDELVLVSASDAYSFRPPAVTSFTAIVDARYVESGSVPPK